MVQDENVAVERREHRRLAKEAEHTAFVKYATDLEELTNRANDLIHSNQWDEAEACCRQLQERFPEEIDGHHRSYEYYKARGDYVRAKTHAQATLHIVERSDGFDPQFPTALKEDIAMFDERIQTDGLTD